MPFLLLGLSHKSASLELRERVSFAPDLLISSLKSLFRIPNNREIVILSTCNRTELYVEQEYISSDQVVKWIAESHHLDFKELAPYMYIYENRSAVQHIMRVASGLDSLVLGEPQILGQLKAAYAAARKAKTVGSFLARLFQSTFSAAKQVRTETSIGKKPVSVVYAAVSLARSFFTDVKNTKVLLVGAGETITLAIRHLHDLGIKEIVIANRTLEKAALLADRFLAKSILLSDIPLHISDSDIIISSTASQVPILAKRSVEGALKKRKNKPIFIIDIAVPRDIESEVGNLHNVYLYTVDDLAKVISQNVDSRKNVAYLAEKLIENNTLEFMKKLRELTVVSSLKSYRANGKIICDQQLQKAYKMLAKGVNPEEVLDHLARSLTNKFLHQPTIQLKKISSEGDGIALATACRVINFNES